MAEGGFDYVFVPELPDEYICIVCHSVLSKPKQIEECGHRFCESCITDMISHNPGHSLQCPIDRQVVADDQIFKDKATERVIRNWSVKCPNYINGCNWIAEFNLVEMHERECTFDKVVSTNNVNESMMKQIEELSKKCEEIGTIKTELQELKTQFQQLKTEYNADRKMMSDLRVNVNILLSLRKEMKELTEQSKQLKVSLENRQLSQRQNSTNTRLDTSVEHENGLNVSIGESKTVSELSRHLDNLSSQFHQFKINHMMEYNNSPITKSDDARTLIPSSSVFEWKCPAFSERDMNHYSPYLYSNRKCFQLSLYFSKYDQLYISLFRCRSIYDTPESLQQNRSSKNIKCIIDLKHAQGSTEFVTVLRNASSVNKSCDRNLLSYKLLNSNFQYVTDGFYHLVCKFKDEEV